jgi:hypothetical protein
MMRRELRHLGATDFSLGTAVAFEIQPSARPTTLRVGHVEDVAGGEPDVRLGAVQGRQRRA